jgi:D-alanyl-D-alanine carboxypeptidase
MEDNVEPVAAINQISYTRASFIGAIFFILAAGFTFSLEYFRDPDVVPQSQTASVIELFNTQEAFKDVALLAQGAIVADIDTGVVLFQRNADAQFPLASLSKVPVVLAVSEVLDPASVITIRQDTLYNSKASQLKEGERWRTRDLISYTLVASSNDGAQTLADAAEESMKARYPQSEGPAVIWRMNDLAKQIGLKTTYFINATGLDASEFQSGAYGSARDVAKLFAYATKSAPELFAKTATSSITITSMDGRVAHAENTDQALDDIPGMILGKTGLTDLAGGNLAVVFMSGGKRYVAVALGSTKEGRFSDIQQLTRVVRSFAQE